MQSREKGSKGRVSNRASICTHLHFDIASLTQSMSYATAPCHTTQLPHLPHQAPSTKHQTHPSPSIPNNSQISHAHIMSSPFLSLQHHPSIPLAYSLASAHELTSFSRSKLGDSGSVTTAIGREISISRSVTEEGGRKGRVRGNGAWGVRGNGEE